MYARLFIFFFVALFLSTINCRKADVPKLANKDKDIRSTIISAYFKTPLKKDNAPLAGFWSVDAAQFSEYIEKTHLKNYEPKPNELSADKIRSNIKDARYFLRIEKDVCDELFFIEGGSFTVRPGRLKKLESAGTMHAYEAIFISKDKTGKPIPEGAVLTGDTKKGEIRLEFTNRKFIFTPEKTSPDELAKKYAHPELSTGLAQY
ncbi:MAG: hypothetical protein LDLANPLL_01008 [Turneriella sp.]|nr:hypothetical protein [Turneriella sp.]